MFCYEPRRPHHLCVLNPRFWVDVRCGRATGGQASRRAGQYPIAPGNHDPRKQHDAESQKQVRFQRAEREGDSGHKGASAMQIEKQYVPQQREERSLPHRQAEYSRCERNSEPGQIIPGAAVHPPENADRNQQAREQGQGPQKRSGAQADQPQRQRQRQTPGQVPHIKCARFCGKPRGALDPHHGNLIVGIGVMDELLAGGPIDNEIALARHIGQRHHAEEQNGEHEHEPDDACHQQFCDIGLCLSRGTFRLADHEGHSTRVEDTVFRGRFNPQSSGCKDSRMRFQCRRPHFLPHPPPVRFTSERRGQSAGFPASHLQVV